MCISAPFVFTGVGALAQDDLDATMHPLDDAAEIGAMLVAVESAGQSVRRPAAPKARAAATGTDRGPAEEDPKGQQKRGTDDVVERIRRDQQSEQEVEGFDVPEDVNIPPPPDDGL